MNFLINYLLESGVSLALLTTVYILLLKNETFFRQNRIFLLASILFSVLLPVLKLPVVTTGSVMLPEVTVTPYRNVLEMITIYGNEISAGVERVLLSTNLLIVIYLTGVLFFFFRLLFRIIQIGFLINQNEVQKRDNYKLVLIDKYFSPFSFLSYVFVSKALKDDEESERMILHELEHIKQGHTFDVLLLEVLTLFQWFNPFMWLLKRVVRENHEYLADRAVLSNGVSRGWYKQLLLNQIVGQQYIITNSFNYSLIKKRIKMMSQIKSSKLAGIKYMSGLVIAIALLVALGCEQKEEPVFNIVEDMPDYPGGQEALQEYIAKSVKYPVIAQENGLQGRVYVSFVVNSVGEVVNAKIARGVDSSLDEEALRVVSNMPVWEPGYQRGKPVSVRFTVPINFALDRITSPHLKKISKELRGKAQFPGGNEALISFLKNNVKYPKEVRKKGISGDVYVTFNVNVKGEVTDAKVSKSIDPLLDKEALRVINSMPNWERKQDGEVNVIGKVKVSIPVRFKLK